MAESSIPLDIQEEIIKRIPDVKSVIRFRSVSKTWKSVIDSPLFVKDHTLRRQHHRRHLFVTYNDDDCTTHVWGPGDYRSDTFESKQRYVSMVDDDSYEASLHTRISIISPVATNVPQHLKTISSSHGLVCVYKRKTATAVILNPKIRKSIRIHVPNNDENNTGGVVGFGVCPRTLDPKLVKITWAHDDVVSTPWQVEVYSLSSGVWRSIVNHNLPPRNLSRFRLKLESEHVVVDHGFIYWLSTYFDHEFQRERNILLSFDVSTEEFTQIYLPDCLADQVRTSHQFRYGLDISTRMDSLVLIEHVTDGESWRKITSGVWKMEEGSGAFTKLFDIRVPDDEEELYTVHGFRNNGEPVIEVHKKWKKRRLYTYEPFSGSCKFTGIDIEQNEYIHTVSFYMETLLLLDHQDCNFDEQELGTEIIVTWKGVELENKKSSIRPSSHVDKGDFDSLQLNHPAQQGLWRG